MLSTEESEVKFLLTKHVPHRRVDARIKPRRETKQAVEPNRGHDDDDDIEVDIDEEEAAAGGKPLPHGYIHTPLPLYRAQHIIFRVMSIRLSSSQSLAVDVLGILDRNGLAMSQANGRSLRVVIPIEILWQRLHPHILTDEETNSALIDYRERVAHVRFERYRDDDTWAPLSVTPEVDLKQYIFDYDSDGKKITSMAHTLDGPLVFTCALVEPNSSDDDDDDDHDDGSDKDEVENELDAALVLPPLVIYTQFLDDQNLSILHWHMRNTVANALRDNMDHIIDTRHCHGTKYAINDFCDFPHDAHKRKVDYRFVVKDRRVSYSSLTHITQLSRP
jgi:hypothetical protein